MGVLPQVTSGVPPSVSGANMASAVVFVTLAEALAVLPPVPVVGVAVGLPVSLGVGVGLADAVPLGVGDALADALPLGAATRWAWASGCRPPRAAP